MATDTAELLHERALARIAETIDILGVASVAATRGTPLYDSATSLLPGARAIVVLGMEIFPEITSLVVPEKTMGEAAARDLYGPHLDYLSGRLNNGIYALARVYRQAGYRALPLPSQGTPTDGRFQRAVLSFKHAAVYAGLGSIGRSSLLVNDKFGPRVRLACLLTDADIPSSPRTDADPCADCVDLCVESCPAGALAVPQGDQPYAVNKFACASYRQATGCCITCLRVCPVGES